MTHEKLVAIANEIFAGIEERKRLSKAAADGTALDESRDAELQDFLKDMRSVVGIEAAIGMNVDPLALAEVLCGRSADNGAPTTRPKKDPRRRRPARSNGKGDQVLPNPVGIHHSGGRTAGQRARRRAPGKWRNMRRDKRMSELRAAHRHAAKPGLAWDDFFAALANKFPARDLLDTHQVSPKALGSRLALTIEKKMRIENAETERRRRNGKGGRPFRINTIHVHDMALEDVAAEYRRRRHRDLAARRKAERRRAGATSAAGTEDETMLQRSHATFAEAVAAGKAIKQSQIDSLLAAIDNDEHTLADLAAAVRRQPCWRALGEDTLRRTVLLRFNALRDQGRIIDRYEHGGRLRLVRRRVCRPASE